jgi:hypothetical protein
MLLRWGALLRLCLQELTKDRLAVLFAAVHESASGILLQKSAAADARLSGSAPKYLPATARRNCAMSAIG